MYGAQFEMSYDKSKFTFVSSSANNSKNLGDTVIIMYHNEMGNTPEKQSITVTFKAKAVGTGSFNVTDEVLSGNATITGGKSTSVKVTQATKTTTKKPVTNTSAPEEPVTPEVFSKAELDSLKIQLAEKIETDYTVDSWKTLQDAIAKAEGAATSAEYNEVRNLLTVDTLVIADFEKEELVNMLIQLMGKSEKDYSEDSWKELHDAIAEAQNAKLKSEYDKVKDKLTMDTLKKKEGFKEMLENFTQGLEKGEPIYIAFVGLVLVLLLVILILSISLCIGKRRRKQEMKARRLK